MRGFVGVLLCAGSLAIAGEPAGSDALSNIIDDAEVDLSFRYRFEYVDDDAFSKKAKASTLRSRIGLQSGSYRDFDVFVEIDDVREVLVDSFNAGQGNTPSRTEYPVVADPESTEINQAYIDYQGLAGTTIRLGRQRINLDNQRFVGGVGWRQNEQTYDGLKIAFAGEGVDATYGYLTHVRRIFGDDVPAGKHKQDGTHLLNVAVDVDAIGKIVGYYYHIDNEDAPTASTATAGLRLTGNRELDADTKLRYTAEFARQNDAADNPVDIDAHYWNLEAALVLGAYDVGVGWEVLSGDADAAQNEAFRTPFATLHAFNGWADKFLNTPAAGIVDKYVHLQWSANGFLAQMALHDFDSEDGGSSLGNEVDLRVGYKVSDRFRGDVFFAAFDGDSGFSDTNKLWIQFLLTL